MRYKSSPLTIFFAFLMSTLLPYSVMASASFDKEKMDQYLSIMEQSGRGILSIEIVEKGKVVYQKQTGFAHYDESGNKVKTNAQTQYRVASITKLFTATLIMQLVEQGKLSLTTTLSEFYPEIKNAEMITIDHMLKHYSGLANYSDFPDLWDYAFEPQSKAQTLKRYASFEPEFKPGSQYQYSNTNYMLLGFIIEELTGQTYQAALKTNIIDKLGLENTQLGSAIDIDNNQAQSFYFSQGGWQVYSEVSLSNFTAAGGIISTPHDLNIFIHALMNGKLVSDSHLRLMYDPTVLYGKGIMLIKPFWGEDYYAYGHDGLLRGFHSIVAYYPEQEMSIAMISNGLAVSPYDLRMGIMSIYFNRPYVLPNYNYQYPSVEIEPKQLKSITGDYAALGRGPKATLYMKDNQLWGRVINIHNPSEGDLEFSFTATSDRTFYNESERIELSFAKSADDTLNKGSFTATYNGITFVFMRRSFWDTYFGWLAVLNPF